MSFEKMNESPESFANWESFVPFLIDTESEGINYLSTLLAFIFYCIADSCLSEAVLHGCCGMLGKTVKSEDIRLEMACRLIVNVFEKNDVSQYNQINHSKY